MMKRLVGSIVLALVLSLSHLGCEADVVTLDKTTLEKPELSTGSATQTLSGSLLLNDSEALSNMIDEQKEHDLKDLEKLWQGTVEKACYT